MRTTWTFYPRGQGSVTLTIVYVPELDQQVLPQGGYLHTDTNTAFVDWQTYRIFDNRDIGARRHAFQRLIRIAGPEVNVDVILKLGSV